MDANCPKCGASLPPHAEFCSYCGTDSGHRPGGWKPAILVGTLILLVVVAAVGLNSTGLVRALSGGGDVSLPATGTTGNDVLSATAGEGRALEATDESGEAQIGVTAELPPPSTTVVAGQLPKEISDWLDHLLRTHNRLRGLNRALSSQHAGAGAGLAPGTFPENEAAAAAADDSRRRAQATGIMEDVNQFFTTLDRDFRSVSPPPECVPIGKLYGAALRDIPLMIGELSDSVRELDISKATAVGEKHRRLVEGRISEVNRLVQELCDRYEVVNRWKLVEDTDHGTSNMLDLGSSSEWLKRYAEMMKDLMNEDR